MLLCCFLHQRKVITYIPKYKLKDTIHNIYNLYEKHDYTLEHVVPQSIYKNDNNKLKCDMHNILLIPSKLNIHRSNYKLHSGSLLYENSKLLDSRGTVMSDKITNIDFSGMSIKDSKRKIFSPPDNIRGELSRASFYFMYQYPQYKDIILKHVIDPYTLMNWNYRYPIKQFERYKSKQVEAIQGNENPFIVDPSFCEEFIREELKIDIKHDYFSK